MDKTVSKEIKIVASEADNKMIPEKSKEVYEREYNKFLVWLQNKTDTNINETVMLHYISELTKVYKPSSLWCIHSKLQTMLRIRNGIDLASYPRLQALMKKLSSGFEPQKTPVFSEEQLRKFFIEAPDDPYLFLKVVVICGVFGSCRRFELWNLRLNDVTQSGSALIITIRASKTDKGRKFAIIDDTEIKYVQLFNKYLALRPKNVLTDRLFLQYINGKCTKQVVGINTFGKCPSRVAKFLELPDENKYTGHAFRRTSASIIVNGGTRIDEPQPDWKSTSTASFYIEEPVSNKESSPKYSDMRIDEPQVDFKLTSDCIGESISEKGSISKLIAGNIVDQTFTMASTATTRSSNNVVNLVNESIKQSCTPVNNIEILQNELNKAGVQITNNHNCIFNIYLK